MLVAVVNSADEVDVRYRSGLGARQNFRHGPSSASFFSNLKLGIVLAILHSNHHNTIIPTTCLSHQEDVAAATGVGAGSEAAAEAATEVASVVTEDEVVREVRT